MRRSRSGADIVTLAATALGSPLRAGWRPKSLVVNTLAGFAAMAISAILTAAAGGRSRAAPEGRAARSDAVSPDMARRFRERMLPHLDAAHNFARYLCRDADAAQDIVQDAFLRAFRSFATYRGDGDRAWLLSIVRNCHHDWRARSVRGGRPEPLFDGETEEERSDLPAAEGTPETSLIQRDEAERVRRQLEAMPEAYREILVLRELEDLSYREISDTTGLPIGTVMSRLARARGLFQKAWLKAEAAGRSRS
jgi:RNA polymerase sigma-70 factor (ECF subfamily)